MNIFSLPIKMLGQSGCRLSFPEATIYVDPYLSNSVQEFVAEDLFRTIPIPFFPDKVTDADWVIITHDHIDHCDPKTLPILAEASPNSCFMGPFSVVNKLIDWGISSERIFLAKEYLFKISSNISIQAVPAAHPEIKRDDTGNLFFIGYLIKYIDKKIYISGDTFVHQEIIDVLVKNAPIHTAFLPVNEHNFFRERRSIIGNMSIREAFEFAIEIGVKQVIPVHYDMFAPNAVDPEEIRFIHKRMKQSFALLINPEILNLADAQISYVVRALNEDKYIDELFQGIISQKTNGFSHEIIVVDSGSTDNTLNIAENYGARIVHINRSEFSFGRALNIGCKVAQGDILVITSAHCVPMDENWVWRLCQPLFEGNAEYVYGLQSGGINSNFSECRIFQKYYSNKSSIPQDGYYCNNANSAILRKVWEKYRFDEELTGLEDMELAQRLVNDDGKVAYVADAGVWHYHNETWQQVRRRFEREAIALQKIMPHIHMHFQDTIRYVCSSVLKDWQNAAQNGVFYKHVLDILLYRINQYWGAYKGNHEHRKLSHADKDKYFYP